MIKLRQAIVVEGRYDKNALCQLVDAPVIETHGFGVMKDRRLLGFLRQVAAARGLIILTDSDGAGFVIRNFLKGALPPEQVLHAYIPDVPGKERRKRAPGKEGKLGVEGMPPEVLLEALRRAGAQAEDSPEPPDPITKTDLYLAGLSGGADSAARLEAVFDYIRDNFKYLSMAHYDAGTTDWAQEAAEAFLQQRKGNCYCFAATFMYCARRLGYQAYVVAGHESRPDNDHAWTMIDEADGTYLYDVQLEYAYLYQFGKGEIDAFRMPDDGGSVYRGSVLPTMYKKLIENSLDILYDKLQESRDKQLVVGVSSYLMLAVYKMFRLLYEASPKNVSGMFRVGSARWDRSADAAMSMAEGDLTAALTGEDGTRDSLEPATLALSTDQLARDYPRHATSLFNLVKNAEEAMRGLKKAE